MVVREILVPDETTFDVGMKHTLHNAPVSRGVVV
jgi:hypothetical protein